MTNREALQTYFERNYPDINSGPVIETIATPPCPIIDEGARIVAQNRLLSDVMLDEQLSKYKEVLRAAKVPEEDIERNARQIAQSEGASREIALTTLPAIGRIRIPEMRYRINSAVNPTQLEEGVPFQFIE